MKKGLIFYAAILSLVMLFPNISALTNGPVAALNPGHNSTQIFISVGYGSGYVTLQNAIDYGYLTGANLSQISTSSINPVMPYHLARQILINVTAGSTNYTMTLQEAVDNRVFISGASRSYNTTLPAGGEYGYNIKVNTTGDIRTFQYAIKTSLLNSLPPAPPSCTTICTWQPFVGHGCGPPVSDGCNPSSFTGAGTSCLPDGATAVCFFGTGSLACYTRILTSTCTCTCV